MYSYYMFPEKIQIQQPWNNIVDLWYDSQIQRAGTTGVRDVAVGAVEVGNSEVIALSNL